MEKPDVKEFMSIQEFANAIGVSVSTLRNWDRSGKLTPHHRTKGNKRVYSKKQVDSYLQTDPVRVIQGHDKEDVFYFHYADNSVTDRKGNRVYLSDTIEGAQEITIVNIIEDMFRYIYSYCKAASDAFEEDRKFGDDVVWKEMV